MITWKPVLICAIALGAIADPVNVGYYATGSAGDWTLNFQVNNNLAGAPDQDLYLFGLALSAPDVVGSPTAIPTWDNSGLGGSNTLYNNVWLDASASQLLPGAMLSGFEVHESDLTLPQTVQWFAFTSGSTAYPGGGNFGDPFNPGSEGLATNLPEPNSGMMLAGVLAGFLLLRRRRQAWGVSRGLPGLRPAAPAGKRVRGLKVCPTTHLSPF